MNIETFRALILLSKARELAYENGNEAFWGRVVPTYEYRSTFDVNMNQ